MADERTFDPQPSQDAEAVSVQDFETGSFANKQSFAGAAAGDNSGSTTGGVSIKDVQPQNTPEGPVKEKAPEKKDRPQDESFKVFTPEIPGCLSSDAVLYTIEKVPLKSLISEDRKNEKAISDQELKLQILSFFSGFSIPWDYQDEVNRIEKQKEADFNAPNKPLLLSKQVVGRLTIKEESKNWYKIAFSGNEGYVEKKHVEIEALDWLTKSHQKETGDETVKTEKKKELDEKLRKKENDRIENEPKGTKKGETYKDKLTDFSKLALQIANDERKLKDVKEKFEKKLNKKIEKADEFKRKSKFAESIKDLTTELIAKINKYNALNQFIKTEREKLLTPEEKAIIKEYKIKVLDEQEDKKTDHLDPKVIVADVENKVMLNEDEFKQYEEGKKQQKLKDLENKLEDPNLDDKKKAEVQDEIKKTINPAPGTRPEDFARKEILLYADKNYEGFKTTEEKKALLHYLMKVSELTAEEKRGLYNFMVLFFNDNAEINEVFGYDGDKINPKTFTEKFSGLEFTLPSDLAREKLVKNKEELKKGKKALRKENLSFRERRTRKKTLKANFQQNKEAIKAPYKKLKDQSKANRKGFRADKKKIRDGKETDKNYKDKLKTRREEFKENRGEIREKKRENPVFLRGLWQKSRKDAAYGSINKRLNYLGDNRVENQANVKQVKDNKRKRSRSAFGTNDKEMLAFAGIMEHGSNFYLDAYELEYLRRTEGDTEKLQEKSIRFYEEYFKGKPDLKIGYQAAAFDKDPSLFYKVIILPGLLFKAFPAKYYQNDIPSKPSEVQDDLLRFWYRDDFTRFQYKKESLEDVNKFKSLTSGGISNIPTDKLNLDWFKFTQDNPKNYLKAYELQESLADDKIPLAEKQEKLYAFYKLYESDFKNNGFATKEALWSSWKGDPSTFFTRIFPSQYFDGNKLVSPTQVYMDLWKALQTGILDTIVEESGVEPVGEYVGEKVVDHLKKNVWAYGIPALSAFASSDIFFKDSNITKSLLGEWGSPVGLFTALVPINKTILDYKRATPWGENQSFIQHKLRFSNQPFGDKGIAPTYPSPPGVSGELKPQDPNSLANYQQMFKTDPKEMLPSLYAGLNYDFLKNRTENSRLMNQTKFSATGFGQFFTPMTEKLSEKDANKPQTYSLLSQLYPLIVQGTYKGFDPTKQAISLANITGREKTDAFLNSMPDYPVFNYGFGLSFQQQFLKYFSVSTAVNYAGVNAIPGMNGLKRLDLWSAKFGTSFNADLKRYWKIGGNLEYNGTYTSSLTPNPNSTSQDAINGIGQQHVLSGSLNIGNGFCEFTGSFSNDLMRGEDASTYSFKFSLNQFADIPKGTFSAQVFMEKRPAVNSMQIPSMWLVGGKLIFQLGNILPRQPK